MQLSIATPPVHLRRHHLTKVLSHAIIEMRHHGNSGRAEIVETAPVVLRV
jgi:hypothetical protein